MLRPALGLRRAQNRLPERRDRPRAFAIDARDREVVAWTADPGGVAGVDTRDLVAVAVGARFATLPAPEPVLSLADNGSRYTAHNTVAFALAASLVPRFTPVRSPESAGIAEAFVTAFERGRVRLNPIPPHAVTVTASLAGWLADHGETHPHRALGTRSPRQFIGAHQPAGGPV